MTPTPSQIERVTKDYSQISKEPVVVEFVKGTMYVYGSEIAVLRLYYKMGVWRANYSENLGTWFYSKDVQF